MNAENTNSNLSAENETHAFAHVTCDEFYVPADDVRCGEPNEDDFAEHNQSEANDYHDE